MHDAQRPANRLAASTSPYLLQHAHNPVDWYSWSPEALARARERDIPIFLSIGYSACHWCHVMERESFESERIASVLNEHFVPIKVDREERPDLDELYMTATQLTTGGGGWPMSVFLTPDLKPFYAGTYFPPQDRWGRPGFETVLRELARAWQERRRDCDEQAERVAAAVCQVMQAEMGRAGLDEGSLGQSASAFLVSFDADHGGFGSAPKFPPSMRLEFLLGRARDHGDPRARQAVEITLDRMARGGMYDHVGGGFHRYSVDERWLVPHFEKMLYDNALLARLYALAWEESGHWYWRKVARETFDYVLRDMTSPEGGFYSATDADSEGEEGRYFVWTPDQVRDVLGNEEGERFCDLYDIRPGGNFEGRSIPNLIRRSLAEAARETGEEPEALDAQLAASRERLRLEREKRVPPLLDDKILCAWNGLMIRAFVTGARVFSEPRYREAAERAAGFVLERMRDPSGRLLRSYRAGRASIPAFHDDYAALALALFELAEETGAQHWRKEALRLLDEADRLFRDELTGACFLTPHDHEPLPSRVRELQDGAVPASNSLAALAWIRAAEATGADGCRGRAAELLSLVAGSLPAHAAAYPNWLTAAGEYLRRWPEGVSLGADEGLNLEIHTSRERIRAGGSLWIAARLAIPPGMHVYAADPGADYLVPTRITLELPRGFSAAAAVYPPGDPWDDGSGAEPVRIYRDSVLMAVRLHAEPACPRGRGELGLALRIQLCDEHRCYAPREVRAAVPVEIGDEDGPPRHAELFHELGISLE